MEKSWIELPNNHTDYISGVYKFLELAKESLVGGRTRCPCRKCKNDKWLFVDEVEQHLLFKGFYKSYKKWIHHEKSSPPPISTHSPINDQMQTVYPDDMQGLLSAAFGPTLPHSTSNTYSLHPDSVDQHYVDVPVEHNLPDPFPSQEPTQTSNPDFDKEDFKYQKLVEAANDELYPGCSSFSKLSFLLSLFHLKSSFHWSAESFTSLLKLLGDAFPQIMDFPQSYYEGKKTITALGLGYQKIHACPNDCVLYWGETSELNSCPVCGTSRWKMSKWTESDLMDDDVALKKGEPAKVLRYFPLIPRLKRIYKSSVTAENMRWHDKERVKDGRLRHPADGLAWKSFDDRYPNFAVEPRNVRLGLASDGFNPYRLMSTNYSTWPVVLIPYNLAPWLCMKPASFILSLIIPGKSSPGNDIDVYMQPLLHELKLLWEGIDVFDASVGETFKMRAALIWTINDFPAYAMLSGWSTKGYKACPWCTTSTPSYMFWGKISYCGCRKWLEDDHPYRSQGYLFNGTDEYDHAPLPASRTTVLLQQEGTDYVFGKAKKGMKKKRARRDLGTSNELNDIDDDDGNGVPWIKRSSLFDLPYWEYNPLRHNLDVMHIEKNVSDILISTLLGMDKSRDDVKARIAIKGFGVKPHLWLQPRPDREPLMPRAPYIMSVEEKERFLRVLQKLRVSDGYGSNLARCVNMKQRRLMNLKSHDNHVLMQDILPVALRAARATKIIDLLSDLSSFFKYLCSTTLEIDELDAAQGKLILTLCEMEKVFLPTFFTIMVHLLLHLVEEAKLGGPVHYRWMYPIERYLTHLKSYVTNRAQPEGSIAEGYSLEETTIFCSRYLGTVETIFSRGKRYDDNMHNTGAYLYHSSGRVIGTTKNICLDARSIKQAHRYVLLHCDEMKVLKDEFMHYKQQQVGTEELDETMQNQWIINEFSEWLQSQVHRFDVSTEMGKLMKALCGGLNKSAKRFKAFAINGYKFDTVDRGQFRRTQNSGVMVEAEGEAYYGKVVDIYELDYYGDYKVVVFRCEWVDIHRGVEKYHNGSVSVNFSKLMHSGRFLHDDPFIFSSQAKQVFFVEDELRKGWLHVIKTKPRDLFDLGNDIS